jgi:hypothetical protein
MSVKLWSNVQVAMQSAAAATKTITGITKASTGVVTSASHGYSNGDYVLLSIQGMWQLDNRVVRVASVATDTFQLEGVDSTLFDTFTSGTASKLTLGTTISSAADINVSGGDFDMIDVSTIHSNVKQVTPGASSPVQVSMNLNWDPSDAGQVAMKSASDARAQRAFLFTFSDSAKWVFVGYVGFSHSPTGQALNKVTSPAVITAYGRPTVYTS